MEGHERQRYFIFINKRSPYIPYKSDILERRIKKEKKRKFCSAK